MLYFFSYDFLELYVIYSIGDTYFMLILLKGMLIGFSFVAPIGMQNVFMFNNALSNKFNKAIIIAIAIWISDAIFSFTVFWGFGAIIMSSVILKIAIMLFGSIFVIWMGYNIIKNANNIELNHNQKEMNLIKSISTAFLVSWINPQAIIDGSLLLGSFRSTLSFENAITFFIGILIATAIWFFSITISTNLLKHRVSQKFLSLINYISGSVVIMYGIYILVHGVYLITSLF